MLIPASIKIAHVLENHEHTVCTSSIDNHFHEINIDCEEFHKQLSVFSLDLPSNYEVIPTNYYINLYNDKPQKTKQVYHSKKSSRGPPAFTI